MELELGFSRFWCRLAKKIIVMVMVIVLALLVQVGQDGDDDNCGDGHNDGDCDDDSFFLSLCRLANMVMVMMIIE